MQITIEISNYPLTESYEEQILDFIERVRSHAGIEVKVNATSTHITGRSIWFLNFYSKKFAHLTRNTVR